MQTRLLHRALIARVKAITLQRIGVQRTENMRMIAADHLLRSIEAAIRPVKIQRMLNVHRLRSQMGNRRSPTILTPGRIPLRAMLPHHAVHMVGFQHAQHFLLLLRIAVSTNQRAVALLARRVDHTLQKQPGGQSRAQQHAQQPGGLAGAARRGGHIVMLLGQAQDTLARFGGYRNIAAVEHLGHRRRRYVCLLGQIADVHAKPRFFRKHVS